MNKLLPYLVLPLISCGAMEPSATDGGIPSGPDQSGTRLKVVHERWNAEDGAQVTMPTNHFLDTKLNVDCNFQIAEDGVNRCLPTLDWIPGLAGPYVNGTLFFDAACTQDAVSYPKCATPKYALQWVPGPAGVCVAVPRMHQLSTALTPAALYRKVPSCAALSSTELAVTLAGSNIYSTTAVAPTEFVKGDFQRVVLP